MWNVRNVFFFFFQEKLPPKFFCNGLSLWKNESPTLNFTHYSYLNLNVICEAWTEKSWLFKNQSLKLPRLLFVSWSNFLLPFSAFLMLLFHCIEVGLSVAGAIQTRASVWAMDGKTGTCWSLKDERSGTCASAQNCTPNKSCPVQAFATWNRKIKNQSNWATSNWFLVTYFVLLLAPF